MAIERSKRRVASARLMQAAKNLLDATTLCAIATVGPGGRAHVNTAYFAWNSRLDLVWLSAPEARHSRNIRARRSAAVAVYDSHQRWGAADRGLQLVGSASELAGAVAEEAGGLYARRFPGYRPGELGAYRFYRLRPTRVTVFDEPTIGAGTFVTARLVGGELVWERTEIYRSAA